MRLFVAFLLLAASAAAQTSDLFSQAPQMLQVLSEITGWKVKRQVPSERLTKEKFSKIVDAGAKEAEHDKDTHAAELTLKMFGLVPWDFNLARESADLITEQAAAFYDIHKKRLFVLDSTPDGEDQRLALAHELAHALADQQFGLEKYLYQSKDDDAVTARQAVIEGQASWLSWAYITKRRTGRAEVPRVLIEEMSKVGAIGEDFPVLSQTPLYMRESLTFPYTQGMQFQDAIYRDRGMAAFDYVFLHPPLSTQQIIHPAKYDEGVAPAQPPFPDLKAILGDDARKLRTLVTGDVGEFDFSAILRQYVDEEDGRDAASHWRGGKFWLYEHKKTKAPLLVHTSEWDSRESAQAFFKLYQETLRGKWKNMSVSRSAANELAGTGDRGGFLLRLHGNYVDSIEGIHVK